MLKETIENKIIELQSEIKKQKDIISNNLQLIEKLAADKIVAINNTYMLNSTVRAYQDMLNSFCIIN